MRFTAYARNFRDSAVLGIVIISLGVLAPIDNQHLLHASDLNRTLTWVTDQENVSLYSIAHADMLGEQKAYIPGELPMHRDRPVVRTLRFMATAYSSDPWQTQGDPFITATGSRTRWGVVASNHLPLGTEFTVPAMFGDQIFRVEDTHSKRLGARLDFWYPSTQEARQFGVKRNVEIHILES